MRPAGKGIEMKRGDCARMAAATLEICARGGYQAAPGSPVVELAEALERCVRDTRYVPPNGWRAIHRHAEEAAAVAELKHRPGIEVTDETTLEACRRLTLEGGAGGVLALNFASPKNPGGGFLGGSRAQEECLARSSALYSSLCAAQEYYDTHRGAPDTFYTDAAIYSPAVPVFRADDGTLLEEPYEVTFVTCPAVNVSAFRQNRRELDEAKLEETMRRRIGNVLALAAAERHRRLVLGAWGCGVFGNDPALIAGLFGEALHEPVGRCFDRVVFAVYDTRPGQPFVAAFREHLFA